MTATTPSDERGEDRADDRVDDRAGAPLDGLHLDRRRLLGGATAAAMVAAVTTSAVTRPWRALFTVVDVPLAERLATVHPWSPAVRAVGEAYLALRPDHRDPVTLTAALAEDLGLPLAGGRGGTGDLRTTALAAVRADLAARRTVRLRGWVASPTEARLAALAVVLHPTSAPPS